MRAPGEWAGEFVMLKDEASGLEGVIAIHSRVLGPGAGGTRFWHYESHEAMLADAARLAEGMSYKNAMADLPLGGAKAVIRRPERPFDREALFAAFGRAVDRLGGRYVTAEDVGTTVEDMAVVRGETRHVAGLPLAEGRAGGDPSPLTARGVFVSMRHAVETRLRKPLAECTVAIQGVGHVGASLAAMLHEAGAKLILADVDSERVARVAVATGAEVTSVNQILAARADVLAPCALGGVLDAASIARLSARLVCGAANNQLATPADGARLADRGVLYAPDYVVNSGGIINVAAEYLGWSRAEVGVRVEATHERLERVWAHAEATGRTPNLAADELAQQAIAHAHGRRRLAAA